MAYRLAALAKVSRHVAYQAPCFSWACHYSTLDVIEQGTIANPVAMLCLAIPCLVALSPYPRLDFHWLLCGLIPIWRSIDGPKTLGERFTFISSGGDKARESPFNTLISACLPRRRSSCKLACHDRWIPPGRIRIVRHYCLRKTRYNWLSPLSEPCH